MTKIRDDIATLREIIAYSTEELHTSIALGICDRLESLLDASIKMVRRPGGQITSSFHAIIKEDL